MEQEAASLLQAHWEEVALNKGLMVLAPDWGRYRALEDAGILLALAAFLDGAMVGYAVTLVVDHLHYRALRYGQNDVLFVAKDHRASKVGLGLIRETERLVREAGGRMVTWHAKEGTPLEALLPRLGYGVQDVVFSRELP